MDTYPKAKVSVITEPGGKIRPVSAGETQMALFMAPAGHILKELLESIPACRVGLTDSANLWRFSEEIKHHENWHDYISTSDLTAATDRARHSVSYGLLKGFTEELSEIEVDGFKIITKWQLRYLHEAASLLCSRRRLEVNLSNAELRQIPKPILQKVQIIKPSSSHKRIRRKTLVFLTECGVLMGEQLCKGLLTLSSISSWYGSQMGWTKLEDVNFGQYLYMKTLEPEERMRKGFHSSVKHFACAGDDHTGIGTKEDLQKIPKFLETMGFEISWPKYRISRKLVSYCQEFGLHPNISGMWERPAYGKAKDKLCKVLHLDTAKLRLITEFQKLGDIRVFECADPSVGKGRDISRMQTYARENNDKIAKGRLASPPGFVKLSFKLEEFCRCIPALFRLFMPSFFESKVARNKISYIHANFGGLGIPLYDWNQEEDEDAKRFILSRVEIMSWPTHAHQTWERGVDCQLSFINAAEMAGLQLEYKQFLDIEEDMQADAESRGTTYSRRKISSDIRRDNVYIDQPVPCVDVKESPYVMNAQGRNETEVVKRKNRSRHILIRMGKSVSKIINKVDISIPIPNPHSIYKNRPLVSKDELAKKFGTSFCKPNLFFSSRSFTRAGKVYRDTPSFPLEPLEEHPDLSFIGIGTRTSTEPTESIG
jgi:hypothetical protein